MLHVVLFPPAPGEKPARRRDGTEIPALVLLPLLYRDLEEYASDDALETITATTNGGIWRTRGHAGRGAAGLLQRQARSVAAEVHLRNCGSRNSLDAAAHHLALEILATGAIGRRCCRWQCGIRWRTGWRRGTAEIFAEAGAVAGGGHPAANHR